MAIQSIPIKLDLKASKAIRDAKKLKGEVKGVGDAADEAGKKSSSSFDGASDSMTKLSGEISFAEKAIIGLGAAAGAAALGGLAKLVSGMRELEQTRQQQSQTLAQLVTSPGVQALSDVTGETPIQVVQRTFQQSLQSRTSREQAELTSFSTRSVLAQTPLRGDTSAAEQIELFAGQVGKISGAGPAVPGELVRGAVGGGNVTVPDIQLSLARDLAAARGSAVNLGDLAKVLPQVLPEARARKIDANYIRSVVAALSLRLPSRLIRSTVLTMMANSIQITPELAAIAKARGDDITQMSARDIMSLQTNLLIAEAGNPAALGEVTKTLGLSKGEVSGFLGLSGEEFEAGRAEIESAINAVTTGDIQTEFANRAKGPQEAEVQAARKQKFVETVLGGQARESFSAATAGFRAQAAEDIARGGTRAEIVESLGLGDAEARSRVLTNIQARLSHILGRTNNGVFSEEALRIRDLLVSAKPRVLAGADLSSVEQALIDTANLEAEILAEETSRAREFGPLNQGRSPFDLVSPSTGQPVINISSQTNIVNGADPSTADTTNRGTGPAPGEEQ